jgi:hypothetical protein
MTEIKKRNYPTSLRIYEIRYSNEQYKILHACGMTHAYTMSMEYWPNSEIMEIKELDNFWKNQ